MLPGYFVKRDINLRTIRNEKIYRQKKELGTMIPDFETKKGVE